MDVETKLYEVGYQLLPMIAEEALAEEVGVLRDSIEKNGGLVQTADMPRMRHLAYTIDKKIMNKRTEFTQAYFGHLVFRAPAERVPIIKSSLDKQEHLLRFMLVETVPYEAPRRRASIISEVRPMSSEVPRETLKPAMSSEEIDKEVEGLIATTA